MKKLLLLLTLLMMASMVNAQRNSGAVKLGYYSPSATDGGFILGYQGNRVIDERFDIGWSIDWFNKNYVDKELAKDFQEFAGLGAKDYELLAKTNIHSFPILFTATGYFPVQKKAAAYFSVGFGLEAMLVSYRNYDNPDDDKIRGAFDFAWRINGGIAYELGSRSEVIAELGYHNSEPSWEYEVEGHVFERVYDMSGFMARVGFKFYY